MRPHSYSDEGIVIRRKSFGEADRILTLYTKNHGRISLIAKSVRKPVSRKRGHIEIFNLIKFQTISGHGMDLMTEAEVVDDFALVRKSLNKISLAYYFMEVIEKITHEGEHHTELFNLILKNLDKLKTASTLKELRLDFVFELLILMGYWPKGKKLENSDEELEKVIERQINSQRVGKRMLQ